MRVTKWVSLAIGCVALVLGIIGIFLPMFPTTPFLLLAAAMFVRSSDRLHNWLMDHRHLGAYIRDYRSGKGIPLRAKRVSLITMWLTSQASWVIILATRGVQAWTLGYAALLFVVAVWVHWFIGYRTPTRVEAGAR